MPLKVELRKILPPDGGLNKRQRCAEGLSVKTMLGGGDLRDMLAEEFIDLWSVCH